MFTVDLLGSLTLLWGKYENIPKSLGILDVLHFIMYWFCLLWFWFSLSCQVISCQTIHSVHMQNTQTHMAYTGVTLHCLVLLLTFTLLAFYNFKHAWKWIGGNGHLYKFVSLNRGRFHGQFPWAIARVCS